MPYYAHIRQDENGETIYQTVAEHLTGTAALCREFAADFGAEADGDLMGLAHDLGKCTDAFQKRLLEGGPVVDHTTAGMLTCIRMKRPSAAACVAGHHGGLLDVGNLRTDRAGEATLSGRFKKGVEGHYLERCGESGVTLPTLPPETPERDPLKASFRTRMLYSCLVDADFLDTERFMDGERGRGGYDDLPTLLRRLKEYIAPWQNPKTALNKLRCKILNSCLDTGSKPKGIYTLTVPTGGGEAVARYPLHTLQSIVSFSYAGASPALMGACAQREIGLAFCSPRGKFLARVAGQAQGNVLLRRMQYRVADDPSQSCRVAGMMIFGKVYNAKWSVERTRRDHAMRIDESRFSAVSDQLQGLLPQIAAETSLDSLRGLEGVGAAAYFSVLDDMILQGKETFFFRERSRRPPLDAFNALLSFAYSLLAHDCASALESVGLDAYVGYLHRDRPGRESLALDLMEELRPCFADRFVLTLINNRVLKAIDFDFRESGAVLLTDSGRRTFLQKWQERKKETITHPFLEEKIPWGLVPYVQSLLLARYLRGDLDDYPPFLWK